MEDDTHIGHLSTTIDNTSIAIVSVLLDEDRRIMVWEMEGKRQVYQKQQ